MLQAGTVFAGRFTVVREIATGGMGAVYEVRDGRIEGRRALKVMLPHLVRDTKLRERFDKEARVGERIQSGHVVRVQDTGVDEATAQPWLLMELLEGETLEARIRREGALPLPEVAWMLRQVGHALGAAHGAGVLHLDLKPANLYLAKTYRAGDPYEVKVLDFGIARVIEAGRTSNELTSQGGTLAWMAPEQADRKPTVRPSIDVWPLGLIAFYMVTGREYWASQNVPEEEYSTRALLVEVQVKALVSAYERAAELGVAGRLPAGFDAWFGRCVVREPEARWRDGAEAINALLPLLEGNSARVLDSGTAPWRGAPSVPEGLPVGSTVPPASAGGRGATEVAPVSPEALRVHPVDAQKGVRPTGLRRPGGVWIAVPVAAVVLGLAAWGLIGPARHPGAVRGEATGSVDAGFAGATVPSIVPTVIAAAAGMPVRAPAAAIQPAATEPTPVPPSPTLVHPWMRLPTASRNTAPAASPAPTVAARPSGSAEGSHEATGAAHSAVAVAEPVAGGHGHSIDERLNSAAPTHAAPAQEAAVAPAADLPERLSRPQVSGVMTPLASGARACTQGQTGTAPVAITIGNDGVVRAASVSGQFAGTPAGDCIANLVRRAHFPAFRQPQASFVWPFVILPPR